MIPTSIHRAHIEQAMRDIDANGIPSTRASRKFDMKWGSNRYPPKYTISIAYRYVAGEELRPELFSGGGESNAFLESLGFEIVPKP